MNTNLQYVVHFSRSVSFETVDRTTSSFVSTQATKQSEEIKEVVSGSILNEMEEQVKVPKTTAVENEAGGNIKSISHSMFKVLMSAILVLTLTFKVEMNTK